MQYYNHKDSFTNVYTYRPQLSSLLAYNMECIIGEAIQNVNASGKTRRTRLPLDHLIGGTAAHTPAVHSGGDHCEG